MFKKFIRLISKWAWKKELREKEILEQERDTMLEGLEHCGWPCQLVELPEYYLKIVHLYDEEVLQPRMLKSIKDENNA